jgi:hypothetical protein
MHPTGDHGVLYTCDNNALSFHYTMLGGNPNTVHSLLLDIWNTSLVHIHVCLYMEVTLPLWQILNRLSSPQIN